MRSSWKFCSTSRFCAELARLVFKKGKNGNRKAATSPLCRISRALGVAMAAVLGLPALLIAGSALAQDASPSLAALQWTQQRIVVASDDASYRDQAQTLLAPVTQNSSPGLDRSLTTLPLEGLTAEALGDGLAVLILHAPGQSGPQLIAKVHGLLDLGRAEHLIVIADADVTGWIYQDAAQRENVDFYALQRASDDEASRAALFEQLRRGLFGYADRLPFGNDDKTLANTELLAFLYRSLPRRLGDGLASQDMTSSRALSLFNYQGQVRAHVADEVALKAEELRAQSLIQSQATLPDIQAFFDECLFCPLSSDLAQVQRGLIETQAQIEAEQAYFQHLSQTRNAAGLRTLLAACQVCDFQKEALALLSEIETEEARAQDAASYEAAKTLDALDRYLKTCQVCAHKEEALARVQDLTQQSDERLAFFDARKAKTLPALDAYLNTCQVCEFEAEAKALSEEILTSPNALAERDSWLNAKEQQDLNLARDYLEGCSICQFQQEAQQLQRAVRDAQDEVGIAKPCLAFAASPQYGGVTLGKIDRKRAIPACRKAVERFADRADLQTALGRALMVNANFKEAKALFESGANNSDQKAKGTAAALGMAAYANYFDLPDTKVDLAAAERFADAGRQAGDHTATLIWSFLVEEGRIQADADTVSQALTTIADQGSAMGQYLAARHMLAQIKAGDLDDTRANIKRVVSLLESAADQQQLDAMAQLARLYEDGATGLDKQTRKAADLYLEAYLAGGAEARIALVDEGRERSLDVMRRVQRVMARQDYYSQAIDGKYGLNTQRALENALQDLLFAER